MTVSSTCARPKGADGKYQNIFYQLRLGEVADICIRDGVVDLEIKVLHDCLGEQLPIKESQLTALYSNPPAR